MNQEQPFIVNDLATKSRSKTEFYNMLTREGGIYLPPTKEASQRFLRKVMVGEKLYVK